MNVVQDRLIIFIGKIDKNGIGEMPKRGSKKGVRSDFTASKSGDKRKHGNLNVSRG